MRGISCAAMVVLLSACNDAEMRGEIGGLRGRVAALEELDAKQAERVDSLSKSLADLAKRLEATENEVDGIGYIATGTMWQGFLSVSFSSLRRTDDPATTKLSAGFTWQGSCPRATWVGIALLQGKSSKLLFNQEVKLKSGPADCSFSDLVVPVPWDPKARYMAYYLPSRNDVETNFARDSR